MPTNTAHYNLSKQLGSEHPSISLINSNSDTIDTELWNKRVIIGTTPPTNSTVGIVGQFYLNTAGYLYECTAVSGNTYTWIPVYKGDYTLIQSYTTAGTFTFTAPDLYGDGSAYKVTVLIDGGGGAGGVTVYKFGGSYAAVAGGGASGCRKTISLTVTPGNTYAVVVGDGGTAVAATHPAATSSTPSYTVGNTGGTSSFNGTTALGGKGGDASTSTLDWSVMQGTGGQSADGCGFFSAIYSYNRKAPYNGRTAFLDYFNSQIPRILPNINASQELANPFDPAEIAFSAGGAAYSYPSGSGVYVGQSVETLSDGLSAGVGVASGIVNGTMSSNVNIHGNPATSPSSGGGAVALSYYTDDATHTITGVSGAGAPGRVRIYARKVNS